MTVDAPMHIEGISSELLLLSLIYGEWGKKNMQARMSREFRSLINTPFSPHSTRYKSFTERLNTLRNGLRGALEHVEAITDNLQMRLNDHHPRSRGGIYSLPPEILSEIFKQGHDNENSEDQFAFDVSQVSKRFRAVAMHTPSLWSSLWPDKSWYQTSLFIERSKGTGLTIHIDAKCRDIRKFLSIVNSHSHRWAKVVFDLIDYDIDEDDMDVYLENLELIPKNLTLPRLVEIDYNFPLPVQAEILPFATWTMPNLRWFRGSCLHVPNNMRTVTDCTLNLTSLDLDEEAINAMQLEDFFKGIPACVSLQLWARNVLMHHPFFDACRKTVFTERMPYLLELTISSKVEVLRHLFESCISTQNLRHLHVFLAVTDIPALSDLMAAHRFDNLEKLVVEFNGLGTFNFDSSHYPSLKHLELDCGTARSPVVFSDVEHALQNLSSITFSRCYHLDADYVGEILKKWTAACCNMRILRCRLPERQLIQAQDRMASKLEWSRAYRLYGRYY